MSLALTDQLAWVVVGLFLASSLLALRAERPARAVGALSWGVFGVFWALLVPHFLLAKSSLIEGVLTAAAAPLCVYAGYLLWTTRPHFLVETRAVALMGLIYLPFQTIQVLHDTAIGVTTTLIDGALHVLGYHPAVLVAAGGYPHAFHANEFTLTVLLACTGLGSIATVTGLVLAVDAPPRRRLGAAVATVVVIYVLNVVRVTFITLASLYQWFAPLQPAVLAIFPGVEPIQVSYLVADKVVSQSLSLAALVVLTLVLVRYVPELGGVVDDVLYLVTGREYDVTARFRQA